jgi:hypothetical protein
MKERPFLILFNYCISNMPGADPGFQVRGDALKKNAPSGGRQKIFGIFRVKNPDFMPKNHIFFNCGGRCEIFGVFRVKNHDFTQKNHIFSNFRYVTLTLFPFRVYFISIKPVLSDHLCFLIVCLSQTVTFFLRRVINSTSNKKEDLSVYQKCKFFMTDNHCVIVVYLWVMWPLYFDWPKFSKS